MSEENVDVVRAGFDALSREDWDALIELLDPEVEWQTTGQFVEGGVYRGHDGVREFLTTLGGEFDDFRAKASALPTRATSWWSRPAARASGSEAERKSRSSSRFSST